MSALADFFLHAGADQTLDCICTHADVTPARLRLVQKHPRYKRFEVEERGRKRLRHVPDGLLRAVQKAILKYVIKYLPVHEVAHGLVRGRGSVSALRPHVGTSTLIRLDLVAFYQHVQWKLVRKALLRVGTDPRLMAVVRDCCTVEEDGQRFLPEGASTSPQLANAAFWTSDCRIARIAGENRLTYTRFMDDILLSVGADERFNRRQVHLIIKSVQRALASSGFRISHDKVRVMRPHQRQGALGLVINPADELLPAVRPERSLRRRLRAAKHNLRKYGTPKRHGDLDIAQIEGLESFIEMVWRQSWD